MIHNIYFDGGSALSTVCVYDDYRDLYWTEKIVPKMTNNQLEYIALIKGINYVKNYYGGLGEILFIGDSELIIKQMKNEYKVKKYHLKQLHESVMREFRSSDIENTSGHFKWVSREKNKAGIVLEELLRKTKRVIING